ncbi:MAG: sarcosine oxidase subunit gamma family protein [Roseobacter sp.]
MFEPVTALNGAVFTTGIAEISEVSVQGMISVRGDLASDTLCAAVMGGPDEPLPDTGTARFQQDRTIAWMSPDELLLMLPYRDVPAVLQQMQSDFGSSHALALNVSDARASFRIKGPHAREVMSKLCPVDFSPAAFTSGMFRRTRMAQVPAAVWLCDEGCIQIVCFRSQAQYVFDLLTIAAQVGSDVNVL